MTKPVQNNSAKSKAKVADKTRSKGKRRCFGRWFKMYDSLLDDAVVQTLEPELFKVWINLNVLASRMGGVIDVEAIAYPLHMTRESAIAAVDKLVTLGLFECFRADGKTSIVPTGWFQKQAYQSSTDRVRRHRENKVSNTDVTACNADETVSCNASASFSSYFSTVGKRSAHGNETQEQALKVVGGLDVDQSQTHGWPTSGAKRKVGVCGTSARATDDVDGGAA